MAEEISFTQHSQEETQKVDDRIFFSLLQRAGTIGRYQIVAVIFMCLLGYLTGGLMLMTPYLFYQDPYQCDATPPPSGVSCFDFVCSKPLAERQPFIPTSPTMNSIANMFGDYRCEDQKTKIDLVIGLMYVGNVVGFLGLTLVGDLMGRKMLLVGNLILCAIGMVLTIFCSSIQMAGIGLFIITCGVQNAFNVCFYFISETMSEQYRQKFSVAIQLFYGLGVLINVLWYYAIGDWQIILIAFYLVPLVFVIIGSIFFIKDTPMCLVTRYKSERALKAFAFIAKINKKADFFISQREISRARRVYQSKLQGEVHQKKHRFSILDLFRYKSLRMMTIMLTVLQCTIIFQFYAPALMLEQFKLNIFINGLVVGVSQIISYPLCYYMITRIKRRYVAYGCFALTFLCSVILIFVWKQGDNSDGAGDIGSNIFVLVLIFLFRFAISVQYTYFYVYFNELYPTQVRVLGTGLVSTMGGVMVTVAESIIDACVSGGFPIMVLFAVLSGLSGLFSSKLPQTLGAAPQDEIKQLREMHVDSSISESLISSSESLGQTLLSGKESKESSPDTQVSQHKSQ